MVIALLELVPETEKRQAMLEILSFVEEHVSAKPECLGCGVFEETGGTHRVLYVEQWNSSKDLHAHLRSRLYLKILNAVELASEEPRFSFHEVLQTESMELIRQLRR